MTIKEARDIIREKYRDEEFHYAEFDTYSKDHSCELQEALSVAIDALDVLDNFGSILKKMSKYE